MDTDGLLGPKYSYADELPAPSDLGIGRDGSFDGIMRAVSGINYYADAIGFGNATGFAKMMGMNQSPLGLRYFVKTGLKCSNGQDMHEYVDTVPKGLPGRMGKEIQNTLGVQFQGMGPGIIEDAAGALNPMPLFKAVTGSGYPRCKQVTLPVGTTDGGVRSRFDNNVVFIPDATQMINGLPHQTRWVFDSYLTQEQYEKESPRVAEGFVGRTESKIAAGVLFALLLVGLSLTNSTR